MAGQPQTLQEKLASDSNIITMSGELLCCFLCVLLFEFCGSFQLLFIFIFEGADRVPRWKQRQEAVRQMYLNSNEKGATVYRRPYVFQPLVAVAFLLTKLLASLSVCFSELLGTRSET